MPTVYIQTLGCRLNQAESENIAQQFRLEGYDVVPHPEKADFKVVNTCTVTLDAGRDSRKAAKPSHPKQRVIATGCHTEMHPEEFHKADLLIANDEKNKLVSLAQEKIGLEGLHLGMDAQRNKRTHIYPLATGNTRAFVKIQDGCNLTCSFCLTTLARGISKSRQAHEIIDEIQTLSEAGCKEAVLTGVHAGSYGEDIDRDLGWLVREILERTTIPRLRLSSLEPWNFKRPWVELWQEFDERLCRHLHMSLQSGCNSVLARMRRCYDTATFAEKIHHIRSNIPGIAITTDIIVGFPGETDDEHHQSLAFVKQMAFADAHIFTYSPRKGTAAANMKEQLSPLCKKKRYHEMKSIIQESHMAFKNQFVNTPLKVLWERRDKKGSLHGLSDNYIKMTSLDPHLAPNEFSWQDTSS